MFTNIAYLLYNYEITIEKKVLGGLLFVQWYNTRILYNDMKNKKYTKTNIFLRLNWFKFIYDNNLVIGRIFTEYAHIHIMIIYNIILSENTILISYI